MCDKSIDQLQRKLKEISEEFGFIGGMYFIFLSKSKNYNGVLKGIKISKSKGHQITNYLYSDCKMENLRKEYIKKAINHDRNIRSMVIDNFKIFSYEDDNSDNMICRSVLDKYGIRSRIAFPFNSQEHPDYTGIFLFMTDMSPAALEKYRLQIWPTLSSRLNDLSIMIMGTRAVTTLNPLIGAGIISKRAKLIIELIAEGYSRTEIAEQLHLTERGVDYHLNRLKILLNAKNNAQLVSAAYKYKLTA